MKNCKITTSQGRGRLDRRSIGTRRQCDRWVHENGNIGPRWKYRNEQVATPHRRYRYRTSITHEWCDQAEERIKGVERSNEQRAGDR